MTPNIETLFSHDSQYWNHKLMAFLHDPPDKPLHIPGHEQRANEILQTMGIQNALDAREYKQADIIASGMDRATLPGYSPDTAANGAIDFCRSPIITHPTGADAPLALHIGQADSRKMISQVHQDILNLLRRDLGQKTDGCSLSEKPLYKNQEKNFAVARFLYAFFLLRKRLAAEDIGGLGGFWHRLPADTRIPDHSIWQHNGLVSALASCFRLSTTGQASVMVFALTPVQDFVGRARKLRDFWSGSLILSWLAFEGILAVIHTLGPDHVLYPSLHDQPLVEDMLAALEMGELLGNRKQTKGVASFPNKFVLLVPQGMEEDIAALIEKRIVEKWRQLGQKTLSLIEKITGREDRYMREQFTRQLNAYWQCHWGTCPLIGNQTLSQAIDLVHQESQEQLLNFTSDSKKLLSAMRINPGDGRGQLYSLTHQLAQSMLAAGKSRQENIRPAEQGIKCDMFGEFEAIRFGNMDDHTPRPSEDPFWVLLRERWNSETDFGKTERLCAIGLVKRLAYRVCQNMEGHPLQALFSKAASFPSTTEMALHGWLDNFASLLKEDIHLSELRADFSEGDDKARRQLAQCLHVLEEPEAVKRQGFQIDSVDTRQQRSARKIFQRHPIRETDKYYAILIMDGDRMGKLINGETLATSWENVLHPELVDRLRGNFSNQNYKNFWKKYFSRKRMISPAVHAAISESLGEYALHTVPAIIETKYKGRLIYAGGDDICAIVPAGAALPAARELAAAYCHGFVTCDLDGCCPIEPGTAWKPQTAKLALHLGHGPEISISAGILISHHKKPLSRAISRAHALLEMAKDQGDRNGFFLELDKRSGGGRLFHTQWNAADPESGCEIIDHFFETADALHGSSMPAMSTSLAYRLASFSDGLLPLLSDRERLIHFLGKQLDRSILANDLSKDRVQEVAGHVAALLIHQNRNHSQIHAESLVIANFLGHCHNQATHPRPA